MGWLVGWFGAVLCFCCRRDVRERVRPDSSETQMIYTREDRVENLLNDTNFLNFANQQYYPISRPLPEGRPFLSTPRWTLYTASTNEVIRIDTNCDDVRQSELHPIVIDAWVASELAPLGITIHINFVSPAFRLDRSTVAQTRLSEDQFVACAARGGTVRFSIGEGLVPDYVPVSQAAGKVTVRKSLVVGQSLFKALAMVHSRGFIHGNIRPETVWIDGYGRVKLIDFSRAISTSFTDYTGEDVYSMSPWQLENPFALPSIRDDFWRGFRLVAILMHGVKYLEMEESLVREGDVVALIWWKRLGHFFNLPTSNPIHDVMESLVGPRDAQAHLQHILHLLGQIKREISSMNTDDDTQRACERIKGLFDSVTSFIPDHETVNI